MKEFELILSWGDMRKLNPLNEPINERPTHHTDKRATRAQHSEPINERAVHNTANRLTRDPSVSIVAVVVDLCNRPNDASKDRL